MNWRRAAPKPGELELAKRASEIARQVGLTCAHAFRTYTEIVHDGRPLTPEEAETAGQQLLAITLCLRDIHDDQDIIDWLATTGARARKDKDIRPTIAFMRVIQRSYGLALSQDASRQRLAIPPRDLAEYAVPLLRFWRKF